MSRSSSPLRRLRYPASARHRARPVQARDLSFAIARVDRRRDRPQSSGQDHADPAPHAVLEPVEGETRSGASGSELGRRSSRVRWPSSRRGAAGAPFTVRELVLMGRYPHAPDASRESCRRGARAPRWRRPACSISAPARSPRSAAARPSEPSSRGARPGAAPAGAGRADRSPRPALPGGDRRARARLNASAA